MACFVPKHLLLSFAFSVSVLLLLPVAFSVGPKDAQPISYHGGPLTSGMLKVGIVWYGQIPRAQRKAILSFFRSLNTVTPTADNIPQVATWWNMVESYQAYAKSGAGSSRIAVKVVNEAFVPGYDYGKVLIRDFIRLLIPTATARTPDTLALIVASKGVTVQDMCAGSCAQHGLIDNNTYVAVGDPEDECPECAWPFVASSGKQGQVLLPPSGDIGADVMVKLLAGGLAGAVTNPMGDGFYTSVRGNHVYEATSMCPDVFASVEVPVDPVTGGSYNVVGDKGTKFLLPAIWNPKTSSCWTPL
ncbi:protein EXORDIUM-like [Vigna radiata var. radiata]|uniref:Protein EXORDIUM-like n=1 Tax=Vigna radiata var. radiata TaxID=3916 RepID=A0A1S3U081_VIGRR|nr:protein EXORDIUM-like [Vigna radiata var. radiata]